MNDASPRRLPALLNAILLTLMGLFFMVAIQTMASEWATSTAAAGIGTVLGLGVAALLGAANVPPPHAERVGLRGLRLRHLLPLLLLLPVAILASEVDNVVAALLPAPDAREVVQQVVEKIPVDTRLALLESVIVAVGLVPVVEEWFFRGVLQQGLVAAIGAPLGILLAALLFAVPHGIGPSLQAGAAMAASVLLMGLAFGYARYRTGSLLAAILLHMGVNGMGVAAMALPLVVAIPGYNSPGAHTPLAVLLPSLASVAAGVWLLAKETPPAIPVVRVVDEQDSFGD